MLLFSNINHASGAIKNDSSQAATITYAGVSNSLMTFNVSYSNPDAEVFAIELTDDQGRILYQKKFDEKNFNKNILLKNMGEKVRVNFTVRAGKNSTKERFDIEPRVKVIEEFVVTKL